MIRTTGTTPIGRLGVRLAGAVMALAMGAGLATAGEVLDRIAESGTLKLGVRTDAPPFAALKDETLSGFSVDLCALVAKEIKSAAGIKHLTGEFVPVDTAQRFEAIESGEIDVLCGATTATLSRRERVSFSIQTFSTGVGAATAADAPPLLHEVLIEGGPAAFSQVAVREAVMGKALGVRGNTTAEDWLRGSLGTIDGVTVQSFDNHGDGMAAVVTGEVDAYFADLALLVGQREELVDPFAVRISQQAFTREPYALAIPRGDEDFRLAIDRALSALYRSGTILKLVTTHFGKPGVEVDAFYREHALPE